MNNLRYFACSLQDKEKSTTFIHKRRVFFVVFFGLIFLACACRDLIRVLKWYVDRIIDAEHQEQIQQVLKVRTLTCATLRMYVTV